MKEVSREGFLKTNLKKVGFEVFQEEKEGGPVFNFDFTFNKKALFQLDKKEIYKDQNGSELSQQEAEEEDLMDDDHASDEEMVRSGSMTCGQDLEQLVKQLNAIHPRNVGCLINNNSLFAKFCN